MEEIIKNDPGLITRSAKTLPAILDATQQQGALQPCYRWHEKSESSFSALSGKEVDDMFFLI